MEKIPIDEVNSLSIGTDSDRRGLSDALGTTHVAINHYRLSPGDGFPGGLHCHMDQEEVFVVLEGTATFETLNGEITVGEGEAIRFAPGEFQSGTNESDGPLVALALGAPRETEDIRTPVECPECGHDDLRLDFDEDGLTLVCPDCGTERIPDDCPECGGEDLRATLGQATETVVVCRDCGTEFENPPLRK